jgi:uncharacterized membrane protein
MSTPGTTVPAPVRRRVKKRILIPSFLLGLILAVFLWAYIRGTWADTQVRNPKTAADGIITQLYRTPEDKIQVRCAVIVEAPPEKVWEVVTDYDDHPKFLPYVSEVRVTGKEGSKWHLVGRAHSSLWGDWAFEADVVQKEDPRKGDYRAFWEEHGEDILTNRGEWTVSAAGEGKSLVVYSLQLEVRKYPSFLARNILLDRLPLIVKGLRDEVQRRQSGS